MSFRKTMIVKIIISIILLTLGSAVFVTPNLARAQSSLDLRGRWDFIVEGLGQDLQNFTVYVVDIGVDGNTGDFFANGCMESPSNFQTPLLISFSHMHIIDST